QGLRSSSFVRSSTTTWSAPFLAFVLPDARLHSFLTSQTDARRLRPILATFLVAYAALAVNSYAYFFLGRIIAEIFIAAYLGLAIVTAKSQAAAYAGTAQRQTLPPYGVLGGKIFPNLRSCRRRHTTAEGQQNT